MQIVGFFNGIDLDRQRDPGSVKIEAEQNSRVADIRRTQKSEGNL